MRLSEGVRRGMAGGDSVFPLFFYNPSLMSWRGNVIILMLL